VTFIITLVVFTFVLCIGVIFKITDLVARGVPWEPIAQMFLWGIPPALMFSVPISLLTASLLFFGRLSADGEITAMKACGISMWQIISRPLMLSVGCVVFCLYINNDVAPRSYFVRRRLISSLGVETPMELLEEGRFIQDFPGLILYIGKKSDDRLSNVRIYDLANPRFKREIKARSGVVRASADGLDLIVDLYDVRINPFSDTKPGAAFCRKWSVTIDDALQRRKHRKRVEEMTMTEIIQGIRHAESHFPSLDTADRERQKMSLTVEFNKRLALSLSCVAFVLLGIPLGVKAHRKESSVGVGISLFLVFNFYLFIIIAESLAKRPEVRPDLIVWFPVLISCTLGLYLIRRGG